MLDPGSQSGGDSGDGVALSETGNGQTIGAVADLRALIVEKLGNSSRADAQGALRELYGKNLEERAIRSRRWRAHPNEDNFPILGGGALTSAIPTRPACAARAGRLQTVPKGPEALAGLIKLAR